MKIGIDAASFFVPNLYLDITDLATKRGIEPEKLAKGLGLHRMAVPDVHEDAATFAAEALLKLIEDYSIHPADISRIYLGTESALDAAKPTASFASAMVEEALSARFGARCFKNCDMLDVTFACIGAVDALQNCLDFVKANPGKKAVVIASDYAKYELASTGEYTQGAGAVALLVSDNPKLLEIDGAWGVASESVFDFFKPRRAFKKSDLANAPADFPDKIEVFTDEPVFDGQYSNKCYQDRIREAYKDYNQKNQTAKAYQNWRFLIFHLPYAFHGKRVFTEIYSQENGLPYQTEEEQKAAAKHPDYLAMVKAKIEPTQRASSEVGNMYTASIFMALLSALSVSLENGEELTGAGIGFLAYGSGSKSKIFTAKIGAGWKEVAEKWHLFASLNSRQRIDFGTYERLHRKQLGTSVQTGAKGFALQSIEIENPLARGARYYTYNASTNN